MTSLPQQNSTHYQSKLAASFSSVAPNLDESQPSGSGQDFSFEQSSSSKYRDPAVASAFRYPPEPDDVDFDQHQQTDQEYSED